MELYRTLQAKFGLFALRHVGLVSNIPCVLSYSNPCNTIYMYIYSCNTSNYNKKNNNTKLTNYSKRVPH
jgi:hypothetical protein